MHNIIVSNEYLEKNFNLNWIDVYCGLKYSNLNFDYPINKARKDLQNKNCQDRDILEKLSHISVNEEQKIINLIIELGRRFGISNINEEEVTNKWHYIIFKYIYDNPENFSDQIRTAQDYAEEWNYPPQVRIFTNPYIDAEFYPGDAEDIKKMRFKYWKKYLDDTKEKYGWRTFEDFLKHEGVPL